MARPVLDRERVDEENRLDRRPEVVGFVVDMLIILFTMSLLDMLQC